MTKKAFTLIEMAVTMAIAAVLFSAITPLAVKSAKIKAAEKTALEMSIIQDAARLFYINSGDWPVLLDDLQSAGYLNVGWDFKNPFNNSYNISNNSSSFTVNTTVDSDIADVVKSSLPSTIITVGNPVTVSDVASTIPPPGASAAGVPPGTSVMWSGFISDIPAGYALCDGTNGTPDLSNMVIVSTRSGVDPGIVTTNLINYLYNHHHHFPHQHTMAAHKHTLRMQNTSDPRLNTTTGGSDNWSSQHVGGTALLTDPTNPGISTTYEGSATFFALAYIMKL